MFQCSLHYWNQTQHREKTHTIYKFGFEPPSIFLEPAFFEPELKKSFIYHSLESPKAFWGEKRVFPWYENLWSFSLFSSDYFPWLYFVDFSVASLYSLFYVTREFQRFLHRGWAWFCVYSSLLEDSCTQNVITKKKSKVNEPEIRMSGTNSWRSL